MLINFFIKALCTSCIHTKPIHELVIEKQQVYMNPHDIKTSPQLQDLQDSGKDMLGSIISSANPSTRLNLEHHQVDHKSILRTWGTRTPPEDQLNSQSTKALARHELSLIDYDTISSSSSMEKGMQKNVKHTSNALGTLGIQASLAHTSKGDSSGKRSHGGTRRSLSNDVSRKVELYKTELCISINTGTPCKYGENCQFAHSTQELQHITRHPRYKTQFCTNFQTYGFCKYNDRCTFIHHSNEARASAATAAHSEKEEEECPIRSNPPPSSSDSRSRMPLSTSDLETKHIERLRALSDPGVSFKGQGKLVKSMHPVVELQPVSTTISHLITESPKIIIPTLPVIDDQANHLYHQQLPQRLLPIIQNSAPSSCIAEGGTLLASFVDMRLHISSKEYTIDSNMSGISSFNPESQSILSPTTSFIKPSVVARRNNGGSWRGSVSVGNEEEEWASKLAYYISTPQNDFDI